MSAKDGAIHLQSLRGGRQMYLGGSLITDHTEHPAFRDAVRNAANLYDFQTAPEHIERMTFVSPRTGRRVSYEYARDNDLYLTYVIVNPQSDRSKGASEQADEFLACGVCEEWCGRHHRFEPRRTRLRRRRADAHGAPECVDAIGGKIPVLVDGGIRRGSDVLEALALGAKAVSVARLPAWGVVAFGSIGVLRLPWEEYRW